MAFDEKKYRGLNSKGFHTLVYNDWGPRDGNPVVCVHGLTGNGHDFDFLAEDLITHGHRLIAVDLPGRGRSDFLPDPMDYNYGQYCQDLNALLAHLGFDRPACVDWLGVSLGGLLGFRMAGLKDTPIKRLIVNDVGPEVPMAALDFIFQVISQTYTFDTVQALEKRMRATRGLTWGPLTDAQWKHMAEHNARALEDGSITYSYDPRIANVFQAQPVGDLDLWPFWREITCPTLVIRGADSLLLTPDIIEKMKHCGPVFDFTEFKGCGHVPSLWAPDHIQTLREWLGNAG